MKKENIVSLREAARRLGISVMTVRYYIARGVVKASERTVIGLSPASIEKLRKIIKKK